VYGPVRTVVWEDGGREAPSYPIGIPVEMHRSILWAFAVDGGCGLW
jgi:hypothetical protein